MSYKPQRPKKLHLCHISQDAMSIFQSLEQLAIELFSLLKKSTIHRLFGFLVRISIGTLDRSVNKSQNLEFLIFRQVQQNDKERFPQWSILRRKVIKYWVSRCVSFLARRILCAYSNVASRRTKWILNFVFLHLSRTTLDSMYSMSFSWQHVLKYYTTGLPYEA